MQATGDALAASGLQALVTLASSHRHLTCLDLSHNSVLPDPAALRLLPALLSRRGSHAPTLRSLDLSDCAIGDAGFAALMAALAPNTALVELRLARCGIRVSKVAELDAELGSNQGLRLLDLRWNNLQDAGGKALASALQGAQAAVACV
jgi:Ran GTPase-activating protein (RanGAP) involved in mRNA processing and transport